MEVISKSDVSFLFSFASAFNETGPPGVLSWLPSDCFQEEVFSQARGLLGHDQATNTSMLEAKSKMAKPNIPARGLPGEHAPSAEEPTEISFMVGLSEPTNGKPNQNTVPTRTKISPRPPLWTSNTATPNTSAMVPTRVIHGLPVLNDDDQKFSTGEIMYHLIIYVTTRLMAVC